MSDLPRTATDALAARVAGAQREGRAPSVVAGLQDENGRRWHGAAGDGSPDTAYRIGSITKPMTAILVLRLVAEGAVGPDDPIARHLPELDHLPGVTVQGLLTHGGGLYAETDGPWWERSAGLTWFQLLPSIRQAHLPASRFHYTNVGFAVLGHLVARLRGVSWWEALRAEVLAPLGMDRTTYHRPGDHAATGFAVHPYADLVHTEPAGDYDAMAPAGQLWSTVDDLLTFGAFLARGEPAVLPEAWRERLLTPVLVREEPGQPWQSAYGLGVELSNLEGRRFVGHGGSVPGFQSGLRFDLATGEGAALLTNSTAGVPLGPLDLLTEWRDRVPVLGTAWRPTPAHRAHLDLTGTWFWGPRPHVATLSGDDLVLTPVGGGRGARFVPLDDGRWLGQDGYFAGELLQVHARGGPSAYLDVGSFRFSRSPYDPDSDIPGGVDAAGWH